ncbi:MAG: FAD-binding oxidoreductase [Bifidobacteriaceae bacterium]|jgi:glycine/D-amino acid oxidase-like deaminating enzyme|nr:FAD-binding oxidoreductase [Bifidobacteriaceae bacterium]
MPSAKAGDPLSRIVFDAVWPPERIRTALAGARLAPYWLEDAAALASPARRPLQGRAVFDLVVVGGGYTGLWTALLAKLRDPALRVAVLEGRTCGWAASGRNGGFVEASLTHGEENGRSRWPDEYETLERLGQENLDQMEAQLSGLGIDCDWERTGSLSVAVEPYQVAQLEAICGARPDQAGGAGGAGGAARADRADRADRAEARSAPGVLGAAAVRALVNSPTYLAGVWDQDSCALVHPAKLALGLARAARESGVEVFEHTRVDGIVRGDRHDGCSGPGGLRLVTEQAVVRAERVALATNAFPPLLRRYRWHTVPVYDYALMTEPLSAAQLASVGWQGRQGVADMANQFHYYRLTRDNRILWGGWDAAYHFGGRMSAAHEDAPGVHAMLASHFFTTFPDLDGLRFTHRWAGAIDTCTRFSQFFGAGWGGRAVYAAGFTGLGVGASRFAARVMLDLLDGASTELTELAMTRRAPLPFPPEPLASIGIGATRRALDRADHSGGRRGLLLKALDAAGLGFDS